TPWCGLTCAYVMATADISGPFGPTDTDRWLWALAWSDSPDYIALDAPRLGCVVVMERSGGGHVTLYESTEGSNYRCRGGNQSDRVNVSSAPISGVVGLFWPRAGGPIPPAERRTIEQGDEGPDVAECQRILGLPADGDFGSITDSGVRAFQGACGLAKDGEVGPMTWDELDDLDARMAAGDDGITDELAAAIDEIAADSPLQSFSWRDGGRAPPGYYAGMGKTYALAVLRLEGRDPAAEIMASPATGSPDKDVMVWYADELAEADMSEGNESGGQDCLRHLFVILVGLGLRESSANTWEGRDMSASNVESTTAEAGGWQTSWNIKGCASSEMQSLLDEYLEDPNGFRPTFTKGLSPTASQLDCYGSGDGATYQWLARYSPAFAALVTAVGLRRLRGHWGPIGRREVDVVPQVDDFLIEVERAMSTTPTPEPEPGEPAEVTVAITTKGNVTVTVEQHEIASRSERLRLGRRRDE